MGGMLVCLGNCRLSPKPRFLDGRDHGCIVWRRVRLPAHRCLLSFEADACAPHPRDALKRFCHVARTIAARHPIDNQMGQTAPRRAVPLTRAWFSNCFGHYGHG